MNTNDIELIPNERLHSHPAFASLREYDAFMERLFQIADENLKVFWEGNPDDTKQKAVA